VITVADLSGKLNTYGQGNDVGADLEKNRKRYQGGLSGPQREERRKRNTKTKVP